MDDVDEMDLQQIGYEEDGDDDEFFVNEFAKAKTTEATDDEDEELAKIEAESQAKREKVLARRAKEKERKDRETKQKEKYKRLEENAPFVEEALALLQKKYAHITLGGAAFVIEDDDVLTTKPYNTVRAELKHMRYETLMGDREFFDDWAESKKTVKYSGAVFDSKYIGKKDIFGLRKYNQWRGWAVEPNPDSNCDKFYDLLYRIICNNRQEEYDYILNWFAHIIQYPTEKLRHQTCIVFRGEKGIGKGTVNDCLALLFNKANYLQTAQRNDLFSRFNGSLLGKCLVFGDEIDWPGDKVAEGLFKDLITSPDLRIEEKFQKAYITKNCCRFILAANGLWVAPVGEGERRFVVFEPSPEEKGNIEYFASVFDQFKDGGAGKFLSDMMARDIEDVDWTKQPRNEAFVAQRVEGMDIVERFIKDCIDTADMSVSSWSDTNVDTPYAFSLMKFMDEKLGALKFTREDSYKCFAIYFKAHAFVGERNYPLSMDKFHAKFRKILFGGKGWREAKQMVNGKDYYVITKDQLIGRWEDYTKK